MKKETGKRKVGLKNTGKEKIQEEIIMVERKVEVKKFNTEEDMREYRNSLSVSLMTRGVGNKTKKERTVEIIGLKEYISVDVTDSREGYVYLEKVSNRNEYFEDKGLETITTKYEVSYNDNLLVISYVDKQERNYEIMEVELTGKNKEKQEEIKMKQSKRIKAGKETIMVEDNKGDWVDVKGKTEEEIAIMQEDYELKDVRVAKRMSDGSYLYIREEEEYNQYIEKKQKEEIEKQKEELMNKGIEELEDKSFTIRNSKGQMVHISKEEIKEMKQQKEDSKSEVWVKSMEEEIHKGEIKEFSSSDSMFDYLDEIQGGDYYQSEEVSTETHDGRLEASFYTDKRLEHVDVSKMEEGIIRIRGIKGFKERRAYSIGIKSKKVYTDLKVYNNIEKTHYIVVRRNLKEGIYKVLEIKEGGNLQEGTGMDKKKENSIKETKQEIEDKRWEKEPTYRLLVHTDKVEGLDIHEESLKNEDVGVIKHIGGGRPLIISEVMKDGIGVLEQGNGLGGRYSKIGGDKFRHLGNLGRKKEKEVEYIRRDGFIIGFRMYNGELVYKYSNVYEKGALSKTNKKTRNKNAVYGKNRTIAQYIAAAYSYREFDFNKYKGARLETHHIDLDPTNDEPANLVVLPMFAHHIVHGRHLDYLKGTRYDEFAYLVRELRFKSKKDRDSLFTSVNKFNKFIERNYGKKVSSKKIRSLRSMLMNVYSGFYGMDEFAGVFEEEVAYRIQNYQDKVYLHYNIGDRSYEEIEKYIIQSELKYKEWQEKIKPIRLDRTLDIAQNRLGMEFSFQL